MLSVTNSLYAMILLPVIGSAIIYIAGKRMTALTSAVFSLAISSYLFTLALRAVISGAAVKAVAVKAPWIDLLGINLSLYLDGISGILLLVTCFITSIVIIYSIGYWKNDSSFDHKAFYSLVLIFMAGVNGVGLSGNLLLFYLFWEMMLLPSYAFAAYFGEDKARSSSIALKYFIFTHIGAVLILFGILMLTSLSGTADMVALKSLVRNIDINALQMIALLFIVGLAVKMAIFPMHSWLPEAYANMPTPATTLIASVMINAPIYAFLRFFSILPRDAVSPFALYMLIFAVISQFYGAIMAMVETNIKKMIAYSSISQMGYVLFGIATLTKLGSQGAAFHMINHGIIKALLFMTVGAVSLAASTYDTRKLGGLASALPFTALTGSVGALAIAGTPLFSAFQSEWLIFAGGFAAKYPVLASVSIIGIVFTASYALLFVARVFFGGQKAGNVKNVPVEASVAMGILAALTLTIGIFPFFFSYLVQAAIRMLGA